MCIRDRCAGYDIRYGLVHVDFDTQKRIVKDSGKWFGDVAGTKELDWKGQGNYEDRGTAGIF